MARSRASNRAERKRPAAKGSKRRDNYAHATKIASIVEVYAIRANAIVSALVEVKDSNKELILSEDFLNDLMRQSMSIDLSDMMEDLFPEPEPEPQTQAIARRSLVVPLDKETDLAIASQARVDARRIHSRTGRRRAGICVVSGDHHVDAAAL